jgi:UMF1 family MFS transporter
MFYDWANSAFSTTIMAGFFPIFFKSYWSSSDQVNVSTAKLAFANSFIGILVAISAPILGAIADHSGKKAKFLFTFMMLGVTGCVGMFFVSRGDWQNAVLFYVVASLGFFSSNNIYDSMLTDVVKIEKDYDKVSAGGFALGYLGGGLLFAMNVWWTLNPSFFGFESVSSAVRASFVSVGIWWFLFSIPILLNSSNTTASSSATVKNANTLQIIRSGFHQIQHTFKEIKHLKIVFTFLLAYWLYIDGVDTIIRMAVDYGMSIGFTQADLITALLLVQFLGFPFTYLIGFLAGKTGTKRMIYYTIIVYVIICIWASFMHSKYEFFGIAFLIATVQGGIQSLSRSYFAGLIPPDKSAEYFGFYNMLGKFATIIGPILIGITNLVFGLVIKDAVIVTRIGMLSIVLLFLGGAYTLSLVDEKKAINEKKYL